MYEHIDEIPRCSDGSSIQNNKASQNESSRYRSNRASNLEGLLEKEIMARECYQGPPGRTYKKRRRSELSTTEIEEIVNCYLTKDCFR